MQGFEDVKISWRGAEYTVAANRQMVLIAEMEDALRGDSQKSAIELLMQRGGPGMARLSMAYGAALRHAGAAVTNDEVYLSIQEDLAKGRADVAIVVQAAVVALISIISPPIGAELAKAGSKEKKTEEPD